MSPGIFRSALVTGVLLAASLLVLYPVCVEAEKPEEAPVPAEVSPPPQPEVPKEPPAAVQPEPVVPEPEPEPPKPAAEAPAPPPAPAAPAVPVPPVEVPVSAPEPAKPVEVPPAPVASPPPQPAAPPAQPAVPAPPPPKPAVAELGVINKLVGVIFGLPKGERAPKWAEPWQTHPEHAKKPVQKAPEVEQGPVGPSGGIIDTFVRLIFPTAPEATKRDPKWAQPWQTHPEHAKKKVEVAEQPKEDKPVGSSGGIIDKFVKLIFHTVPEGTVRDPKWAQPLADTP
ncbi:lysine-rich arabinogalactan protein 19-like isoform X2 [Penaeus chinensis]|uniref:lysine-rich arabinogalactan protein 19-like isoform X2 n=1 Tax=Penaeus chinensis TaxID=139456 RepID=UPI001FB6C88F|nr:lysine-rich arabinogalactan protein 19-like isoform X2 [Penaeus chinensis]